jgi:hypothetical protein
MILKENEENGEMFLNSTSGYLLSSGSAQEKKNTHWDSGIRKIPGCGQICLKLRICATPGSPARVSGPKIL